LSWLVLFEVIAFFVSFFQLPEWTVAVVSFCILVVVCILNAILEAYPWVRDFPMLGNLHPIWVGIPLGLYVACLVRVGIGFWQGRASFFTRVANYLAVSLVPGLLWLAMAFRTTNDVLYDFRYLQCLHPVVYWLRCATVFVLIPGLSCISQYVSNNVDSLPE
jgi:hypothetical protein